MEQEQKVEIVEKKKEKTDGIKQRRILYPKKTKNITKRQAKKLVKSLKKKKKSKGSGKNRKSKQKKRKIQTKKKGQHGAKKTARRSSKKTKKTSRKKPIKRSRGGPSAKLINPNIHPPTKKEKIIQTKAIRVPRKKKGGSMEEQTTPADVNKVDATTKPKDNGLIDPEKIPFKVSNVFNVGQYIRKQSTLSVSPGFVHEIVSRIRDQMDIDIAEADRIATAEGMKTLMEKHAIKVYNYRTKDAYRIVTCGKCGGSFAVDKSQADTESIQCCPFCMKKGSIEIV